MATPWTSTVEQLRGPAAPPPPQPTEWTSQRLRTLSPDRPPGGFARGGPYAPPDGVKPFGTGAPAAPAAAPPVPPAAAAETKSVGLGRRVADALRNPGKTLSAAVPTAHGVGKAAGVATRVLGPAAAGADVVSHLNDFKIDDPTNDSSLSGTFNALRKGDFSGAGRSLSKGALEAGMDLGSAAANVADIFVPGKAPVSTAYNSMLREKFGEQLVDRTGTAPAAPAAPAASAVNPNYGNEQLRAPAVPRPPTNVVAHTGNSFNGTDIKPGFTYADGSQGKGTVTSLDTSEGHRQNLLELQRNAAERANIPAPAGAAGIGGGSTFGQDLRAKTDAGRTPTGLSARQAANFQQQQAQTQQQGDIARAQIAATQTGNNNQLRVAEMNNATQRENNAATTRTAMAGHEMDLRGRMAPLQLAQWQRGQHADVYRSIGAGGKDGSAPLTAGDHLAAAQRFHTLGLPEQADKAQAAAAAMTAHKTATEAQAKEGAAGTERLLKPFFAKDVVGKDGAVSQQFDDVAVSKAAARLRGQHGSGFDQLPDDIKRGLITDAVTQFKNAEAEKQVMPGFVDRAKDLVGLYDRPAELEGGQRNIVGGKTERAGLISPPGVSRHSTLLRLPDGRTINYGEATREQLADIEARTRLRN